MRRDRNLSVRQQQLLIETIRELERQGRLHEEKLAMQHGSTSIYRHSVHVAYVSLWMMEKTGLCVDERTLIRGALLHDYFLYDWHKKEAWHRLHGFRHPAIALKNAEKDFELNSKERNMILRHMFPLTLVPPSCKEAWLVCVADKWCALGETIQPLFHVKHFTMKFF